MSFVDIARTNYVARIGTVAAPPDLFEYIVTLRVAGRTKLKYLYATGQDRALAEAVNRWPTIPIERVEASGRRMVDGVVR